MSPYTVGTYIRYCKAIPFHFKGMSILNAEKFSSFKVADLTEAKSEYIPAGAVAMLWIWSKYAPQDSAGWRSTGRHCYLDSTGHRISDNSTQFDECADAWLASVRDQIAEEELILNHELRKCVIQDLDMARPL